MFKLLFLISAGYVLYRLFIGKSLIKPAQKPPVQGRYNDYLNHEGETIDYEEVDNGKKTS